MTTTGLTHIFKALSDETRFNIINLLLTRDLCVGALAHHLGISKAAVSQHLKQLRDVGIVKGEKRGYWTHYMVERGALSELARTLTGLTNLEPCRDGGCTRREKKRNDSVKGGENMCNCSCQRPDKLKGEPKECSPEQIKECHGEGAHPCEEKEKQPGK